MTRMGMIVALVGMGCGDPGDPIVATPSDWMGAVYADHREVALGRILLPGAFNSTSYACDPLQGISPHAPESVLTLWGTSNPGETNAIRDRETDWAKHQDRPLAQQLEEGIRFLEINLTLKDGVLTTWHSVYGVPVDVVLDDVVAFAAAHPAEAIVLTFGLDLTPDDWPLLADALLAPRGGGPSMCDLLFDDPDNAATAALADLDAAGRNLVWGPDAELKAFLDGRGCGTSTLVQDRRWSITTTPEGVSAALADSVDSRNPEHLLVNDFAFSLDGSATTEEQVGYVLGYASVREATEALGFAGDFPGRMITEHDANDNMNVFAGAMYQDTNLIAAAIAENEARVAALP